MVGNEHEQHRRLRELMQDTAGWGAFLFLHRTGDVAFITPIVPALRGYEIVAASPDGTYDVWRDGQEFVESSLSRSEMATWLADRMPPDVEMTGANLVRWTEETFDHYGIRERR